LRFFLIASRTLNGWGDESATSKAIARNAPAVRRLEHLEDLRLPCAFGAAVPSPWPTAAPGAWVTALTRDLLRDFPVPPETPLFASIGWPGWTADQYKRLLADGDAPPIPEAPGVRERSLHSDLGLTGPLRVCHSACAAGTQLFGDALGLLRSGSRFGLVASGDSRLHPAGILGYDRLGALAPLHPDGPSASSRPFSSDRSGFVIGEGAAVFLLEAVPDGDRPSATPVAEILSSASTCDAFRLTDPEPGGEQIARCIRLALDRAGLQPDDVDIVLTHGTGTRANDAAEATALLQIFPQEAQHRPACLALKSMIGHCGMASGPVELGTALTSLRQGLIPPILNLTSPDPITDGLDLVPQGRPLPSGKTIILKNSFGFGGQNSCLLLRWNNSVDG